MYFLMSEVSITPFQNKDIPGETDRSTDQGILVIKCESVDQTLLAMGFTCCEIKRVRYLYRFGYVAKGCHSAKPYDYSYADVLRESVVHSYYYLKGLPLTRLFCVLFDGNIALAIEEKFVAANRFRTTIYNDGNPVDRDQMKIEFIQNIQSMDFCLTELRNFNEHVGVVLGEDGKYHLVMTDFNPVSIEQRLPDEEYLEKVRSVLDKIF